MSILADVGISLDQATAAIIGMMATAAFNAVKNSLLSPGAIKQIEKENVMRDAKLDKLFEKTDRFEKYIAIAEDRAKREEDE